MGSKKCVRLSVRIAGARPLTGPSELGSPSRTFGSARWEIAVLVRAKNSRTSISLIGRCWVWAHKHQMVHYERNRAFPLQSAGAYAGLSRADRHWKTVAALIARRNAAPACPACPCARSAEGTAVDHRHRGRGTAAGLGWCHSNIERGTALERSVFQPSASVEVMIVQERN